MLIDKTRYTTAVCTECGSRIPIWKPTPEQILRGVRIMCTRCRFPIGATCGGADDAGDERGGLF